MGYLKAILQTQKQKISKYKTPHKLQESRAMSALDRLASPRNTTLQMWLYMGAEILDRVDF